jgi:hypothetical protein
MEPIDPLSQYLALLRIRQRAARRNGWFLSFFMFGIGILGVIYLRQQYEFDWGVIQFPFMFLLFGAGIVLQAANESMFKSMLEFGEVLRRSAKGV